MIHCTECSALGNDVMTGQHVTISAGVDVAARQLCKHLLLQAMHICTSCIVSGSMG